MKVVINRCYGGFSLSPEGLADYLKRKGEKAYFYFCDHSKGYDREAPLKRWKANNKTFLGVYTFTKDQGDETANDDTENWEERGYVSCRDMPRDDPDLVATVESLGDKANGECAELGVVEIPDGVEWFVDEYDGMEHVNEAHRSWS